LADDVGGVFDSATANVDAALFPEQRSESCTWAEVRDRADLLVYWRCRLGQDHWRHEERILEPARRRGARIHFVKDEADLASIGIGTKYGVVIHEPEAESLFAVRRWVAHLNQQTRFRMISLGRSFNVEGPRQVLCWQGGYSGAVSFQRGYPRSNGSEFSAEAVLSRGEVDAVVMGVGAKRRLGPAAIQSLERIPHILFANFESGKTAGAQVVFLTSIPGIDSAGTVFRSDGLTLPLRPPLSSSNPDAVTVLKSIRQSLRQQTV
jgi:formylmethanofuran dehydrogenase subunit B